MAKSKAPAKKKLLNKPKRPMSAYNVFFKEERARILARAIESNDKHIDTSFESLGKMIGDRWQEVLGSGGPELEACKAQAAVDSERYKEQMKVYYDAELKLMCQGHIASGISVDRDGDDEDLELNLLSTKPDVHESVSAGKLVNAGATPRSACDGSAQDVPMTTGMRSSAIAPNRVAHAVVPSVEDQSKIVMNMFARPQVTIYGTAPTVAIEDSDKVEALLPEGKANYANSLQPESRHRKLGNVGGTVALDCLASAATLSAAIPKQKFDENHLIQLLMHQKQAVSSVLPKLNVSQEFLVDRIFSQHAQIQNLKQQLELEREVSRCKDALLSEVLARQKALGLNEKRNSSLLHMGPPSVSAVSVTESDILQFLQRHKLSLGRANNYSDFSQGSISVDQTMALEASIHGATRVPPNLNLVPQIGATPASAYLQHLQQSNPQVNSDVSLS